MGLLDEIKCEYLLPNPEVQAENFQTKSLLDMRFSRCFISKDGKLIADGVDLEFHGIIYMCTYHKEDFYEYSVKFTDGKVVEIKPV